MERKFVKLPSGDRLGYRMYGSGGRVVVLLHGLVGSSLLSDAWVRAVEAAGVTLIAPERPGYGESSRTEMERVADFLPMARALAGALGLTSAAVVGMSAGGPYAYAMALALPEAIDRVWILGGVPAVYEARILAHYSQADRQAYDDFVTAELRQVQEGYIAQMQAARAWLADKGAEPFMTQAVEEVLAQECFGMAQESRLQRLPWGLELSALRQPVGLYHAAADEIVPFAAAREMPAFFSNATFEEMDVSAVPSEESIHSGGISRTFERLLGQF